MLTLNDVKLCDLRNQSIISLATDLGCNIKYPSYPRNKYLYELIKKDRKREKISKELQDEYDKEQERIDKEYDKIYSNYIESLINWLDNNGYIKYG